MPSLFSKLATLPSSNRIMYRPGTTVVLAPGEGVCWHVPTETSSAAREKSVRAAILVGCCYPGLIAVPWLSLSRHDQRRGTGTTYIYKFVHGWTRTESK